MATKISTFIITYNVGYIIERCLEKLTWCDEIVIVDSGSTDNTVSICERYGAKIYYRDFDGFGTQKQFALSCCTNEWVLNLDADEILSDELIEELKQVVENKVRDKDISGYYIKMRLVFLSKIFNYGNESNRDIMRFFKKSKGYYTQDLVHEKIIIEGNKSALQAYFLHYSYKSLTNYIDKANKYTSLSAEKKKLENRKYGLFEIIIKPPFSFIKSYFFNLNFLNGREGFYWSFLSSFYDFIKCIKVEELYKK